MDFNRDSKHDGIKWTIVAYNGSQYLKFIDKFSKELQIEILCLHQWEAQKGGAPNIENKASTELNMFSNLLNI